MAKVKMCLDAGCTEYILLDDGKTIVQPKVKCDVRHVVADFQEQFDTITKETTETVYASRKLFDVKEGDELNLSSSPAPMVSGSAPTTPRSLKSKECREKRTRALRKSLQSGD